MRITTTILLLLAMGLSASAQDVAIFEFDNRIIKFPKAEGGDVLNFTYTFRNIGGEPLIIDNIKVACTCTKPNWPKHPIMPGQIDSITVEFNTKTVWGWQEKELRIYSNAQGKPYNTVIFKGNVKKGDYVKEEQDKK